MILGYCRCSTQEQTDGSTMDDQEQVIRGLAMMRGAKASDIAMFCDPGVSGATALSDRPGGAELLAAAKKGDVVCAAKLDRLFRSAADALTTAEDLKTRGIELILVDMGNSPVTENGASKLFFGMLSCFAEFERDRIAERIALGKKSKRVNGGFLGGDAPFGFKETGIGREAKLVPDAKEQDIIRLVKDMRSGKASLYEIARNLNRAGYRNRSNGVFQAVQVQRMLERELCGRQ